MVRALVIIWGQLRGRVRDQSMQQLSRADEIHRTSPGIGTLRSSQLPYILAKINDHVYPDERPAVLAIKLELNEPCDGC